jgi:LysM repeat protein
MSSSSPRRVGALVGPVLVGAFFLASCGATDEAATRSTIDLSADSTAFVVRPPATTQPPVDTAVEEGVVTTEQEYVVQSGDTPIGVANAFGVSLDELVAYNEWSSAALPFPGETIKIPPGGTAPGTQAAAESTSTETDEAAPAETIPDAGDNCSPGEYTIVEGDYEGKVAANFDVTVEALRAANASTQNYSSFYPGLVIVIPAKSDC